MSIESRHDKIEDTPQQDISIIPILLEIVGLNLTLQSLSYRDDC